MAVASGKAVGSSSTGRISHIAPVKPAMPSLNKDLAGDTTYRTQFNEANRAGVDYQTRMGASQNSYNIDYTRNLNNQNRERGFAQRDQADDFASRGMSHSGLRTHASSDLTTDFDNRKGALNEGLAQFSGNLNSGFQDFQSQQRVNDRRYQNEAINRRATAMGAGL